jgi:hypothetical protein
VDARIARRAVAGAYIAGIVADLLFHHVALGVNVPIATLATLALVAFFGHREGRPAGPADPVDWWLAAVAAVASLGPALRTDPSVVALDLWLVAFGVAAWAFAVSGVPVTRRAARAVAEMGVQAGVASVLGLAWLLTRVGGDGFFARGFRQLGRATPVLRGLIIAVPILAGFALLLGSADAVFGRAIDDALRLPDFDDVLARAIFVTLVAVLIAGPIMIAAGSVGLFDPVRDPAPAAPTAPIAGAPAVGGGPEAAAATAAGAFVAPARRSGSTEAIVVLIAVDVLFAVFAAIQVVFLFGGADTLAAIGMTYSDYARQGYFQLVGVVALAGLLLIGAHEIAGRRRELLAAGLVLLVLTGVILASAALRLRLYQDAYGWTELRFFVAASIAWLAAAVVIAVALLAANRMRWLAHGLAASAVAITLAVSAIGPQAFVMEQNIARVLNPDLVPEGGHSGFDLPYALSLGDDAIPQLVAAVRALPEESQVEALRALYERRRTFDDGPDATGWQSWNLSRIRAREALASLPDE